MLALSNLSPWLTAEDDVDTGQHQRQVAYSDLADEFVEQAAIDGDNLRHIGYRVVRQASVASRFFMREKPAAVCTIACSFRAW